MLCVAEKTKRFPFPAAIALVTCNEVGGALLGLPGEGLGMAWGCLVSAKQLCRHQQNIYVALISLQKNSYFFFFSFAVGLF